MSDFGGVKLVLINLDQDGSLAAAFLSTIVGKDPQDYKEFWVQQQVKGLGSAPMIQKTSTLALSKFMCSCT